jgi:hypothetical protein
MLWPRGNILFKIELQKIPHASPTKAARLLLTFWPRGEVAGAKA